MFQVLEAHYDLYYSLGSFEKKSILEITCLWKLSQHTVTYAHFSFLRKLKFHGGTVLIVLDFQQRMKQYIHKFCWKNNIGIINEKSLYYLLKSCGGQFQVCVCVGGGTFGSAQGLLQGPELSSLLKVLRAPYMMEIDFTLGTCNASVLLFVLFLHPHHFLSF